MNWYNQPQKINNWANDINYVMFIDENGNAGKIINIFNKRLKNEQINDDEKYFTITGVIFEKHEYSIMRNNIRKLKEKYWKDGFYFDSKNKESRYVCFHSRDIRNHTGAFNESLIDYNSFMNDLSNTLKKINCKIISVTINLEDYVVKNETTPVYDKAFDLLLERFIYATKNNRKSIIILESRGKKDDKDLLSHISNIIFNKGTSHIKTTELSKKIFGVYFNPKWYGGHYQHIQD